MINLIPSSCTTFAPIASIMNSQPDQCLPAECPRNSKLHSTPPPIEFSSSTASTIPTPAISPPSPATSPTLLSLPDEILSRILSHLLTDCRRGTPYYPPSKPPFALLTVARVSTALRKLVSRLLTSDDYWFRHIPDMDFSEMLYTADGSTWTMDRVKCYMNGWYRLAGSNLKSLTCCFRADWYSSLMDYLLPSIAGFRPKLVMIDLSLLGIQNSDEVIEALRALLQEGRHSLVELRLPVGTDVAKVVEESTLTKVRELHLILTENCNKHDLLSLMASLKNEEGMCTVEELHVKVSGICPEIEKREWCNVAGESVKVFKAKAFPKRHESRGSLLSWIAHLEGLERLSLDSIAMVDRDVKALLQGGLQSVELVKCEVTGLVRGLRALNSVALRRVRRLELLEICKSDELKEVGRIFAGIEWLGLKVMRDSIGGIGGMVEHMEGLQVLEIAVCGGGKIEEGGWELMAGLMRARRGLKKLIVQRIALPILGVEKFFERFHEDIEYTVLGLHVGGSSMSEAMIWLLEGVLRKCRKVRILCFGMNIVYDQRAEELHDHLLRRIKDLEKVCPGLDGVWLRGNANSLVGKLRHSRRRPVYLETSK